MFIQQIDGPELELGREYLIKGFESDEIKAYHKFMVDNAVAFGADKQRAEEELKDVVELEIKLANVSEVHVLFYALKMSCFHKLIAFILLR